jgi:hypothetical protein
VDQLVEIIKVSQFPWLSTYLLTTKCLFFLFVEIFVIYIDLIFSFKVLGTPTREEIKCMNPSYTDYKFPQIKAHPWHKVSHILLNVFTIASGDT